MDDFARLDKYKQVWEEKEVLRMFYNDWYKQITADLSKKGKTLEIGSGIGKFQEYNPKIISSDILKYPWLDLKIDATKKIPFKKDTLGNIVLIDVLHHVSNPTKFLDEAFRVLKPGGKIIMLEPYPSFFSLIAYRLFHPEPFIFNANAFKEQKSISKEPWDSNQAIPYLLFFKHKKKFEKAYSQKYTIKKRVVCSFIIYPLTGGFENSAFFPKGAYSFLKGIEKMLTPFRKLFAFRCYVILEKSL